MCDVDTNCYTVNGKIEQIVGYKILLKSFVADWLIWRVECFASLVKSVHMFGIENTWITNIFNCVRVSLLKTRIEVFNHRRTAHSISS